MTISVSLTDTAIVVELTGPDALWAVRRRLEIPRHIVTGAEVVPARPERARLRWRLLGTGAPGIALCGRFSVKGAPGEREFWCTYRDPELLRISTTDAKLRRVVLQHPERAALAARISAAHT